MGVQEYFQIDYLMQLTRSIFKLRGLRIKGRGGEGGEVDEGYEGDEWNKGDEWFQGVSRGFQGVLKGF